MFICHAALYFVGIAKRFRRKSIPAAELGRPRCLVTPCILILFMPVAAYILYVIYIPVPGFLAVHRRYRGGKRADHAPFWPGQALQQHGDHPGGKHGERPPPRGNAGSHRAHLHVYVILLQGLALSLSMLTL